MAIESPSEECGVFGIFNTKDQVAESIYFGLFAYNIEDKKVQE